MLPETHTPLSTHHCNSIRKYNYFNQSTSFFGYCGQTLNRAIIINISGLTGCLANHIIPYSSMSLSSIFSRSDSSLSESSLIVNLSLLIWRPLCSGHVLKAEHGCTDTTGWEESTKPELIKAGKLQRPCLTLIDLYQNTGIHVVQMLAQSTETSVGEEVNKHSLIRLHQRPSHHLGNLVMLNNFSLPPTRDFKVRMG